MIRIGVLGGGQLARFLLTESNRFGWSVSAFCENKNDPAFALNKNNFLGSLQSASDLQKFYDQNDLVTFESEFIDAEKLRSICGSKAKTFPKISLIEKLQDRKTQKESLGKYKLPTVPSFNPKGAYELRLVFNEFPNGIVLKKRRFGYDGYGTYVLRKISELNKFLSQGDLNLNDFIVEPFVQFNRELAIMVFRSRDGSTGRFPLVEWKAKNSKCWWAKGPVKETAAIKNLNRKLLKYMRAIDYVGVMAFELFETKNAVFINEVAPRVHNSMHHSLTSLTWNQFQIHMACMLGLALPKNIKSPSKGFAMVNLIGTGKNFSKGNSNKTENVQTFWYQKVENRKGRKMGHINAIGKNPNTALNLAMKEAAKWRI